MILPLGPLLSTRAYKKQWQSWNNPHIFLSHSPRNGEASQCMSLPTLCLDLCSIEPWEFYDGDTMRWSMHASGHVVTTFECLSQLNMIGPSFSCPFTDIILTFCNYRATGRPSKPVHISKLGKKHHWRRRRMPSLPRPWPGLWLGHQMTRTWLNIYLTMRPFELLLSTL